eukprot:scaffold268516_cov43-Prasinocladus_malaysianus.AAC.1
MQAGVTDDAGTGRCQRLETGMRSSLHPNYVADVLGEQKLLQGELGFSSLGIFTGGTKSHLPAAFSQQGDLQ